MTTIAWTSPRDVPMGAWGALRLPNIFKFARKVGQKSAKLQESWLQYFFCDFFARVVGQ